MRTLQHEEPFGSEYGEGLLRIETGGDSVTIQFETTSGWVDLESHTSSTLVLIPFKGSQQFRVQLSGSAQAHLL